MTGRKYSRQRELIKQYLASTTSHPTADMVYDEIRKTIPNISLGTVYRNLNQLTETGEIIKLSCGGGCDHFDGNILPHYHFICTSCGAVLDLEMDPIDFVNECAGRHFDGRIEGNRTYFYGTCPDCLSGTKAELEA